LYVLPCLRDPRALHSFPTRRSSDLVSPWLTALSSVATNNSGFMFIGLIGYAYASGFEAIWLQVAWITGDLLAWNFVHHRIRERSDRKSTRLNSSHVKISYAVFCLKK